jgi:hypothetical protein
VYEVNDGRGGGGGAGGVMMMIGNLSLYTHEGIGLYIG